MHKRRGMHRPMLWLAMLTLMVAGCCADTLYEVLSPEPTVRLPQDEGPHCSGGEWWYYTGTVTSETSKTFGIEAVIFHVPGWRMFLPTDIWAAHYAVLNVADGTYVHDQAIWAGPAVSSPEGFDLSSPLVQMAGEGGQDHLSAALADGNYALSLDLSDIRGVVLHQQTGYVSYGDLHSFYYSRPRMQATGTITVDGQPMDVQGELWFDRQWGRDVADPSLRWDWFSLRLDDGSRIMLFVFRDENAPLLEGTYVPPTGEPIPLSADDFTVTPASWWISEATGGVYPLIWQITIIPQALNLTVTPIVYDQEFDARTTTRNVYWEGLCTITGTQAGQPISGSAYLELTNYLP